MRSFLSVVCLVWLSLTLALSLCGQPLSVAKAQQAAPPEIFGMVGRDPWYEWQTNPRFKGSNLEFLENMARELKQMGVRYLRIEFRADVNADVRGGEMNYARYDAFVNDIAPRYGIKILGLLGYGLVNWIRPEDRDLHFSHFNDVNDEPNGSNPLIRFFAFRARDLIARYGDKVAAWEVLNEINYWEGISLRPDAVAALMVYTYGLGKTANPNTQIIIGAQISPQDDPNHMDAYTYLNIFFQSGVVQEYFNRRRVPGFEGNPYPWDGLAWHPYYPDPIEAAESVRKVIGMMRSWGDNLHKVWITEVGRAGVPNGNNECGTSADELAQADYLTRFYTNLIDQNLNDVAAIFWFKYEDFSIGETAYHHGVVQLATDGKGGYAPNGGVTHYKAAYYAYQRLAKPILPVVSVSAPAVQNSPNNLSAPYYFAETGHTLNGAFLKFWLNNGGLALFGLPLTEEFEETNFSDGRVYTVQYFERERLEYHPEKAGTRYEVLMGLLSADLLRQDCRSFGPLPAPANALPAYRRFFKETGHYVAFGFKEYWEKHGGLAIFGYPLSEEIIEISPIDGKEYNVQYFERARFELHPDALPEYQVQLALLGSEMLRRRGWLN